MKNPSLYKRMSSNILVVPWWIAANLKHHKLTIDSIYNYSKIKDIIAYEDIVSLFAINRNTDALKYIFGWMSNGLNTLTDEWYYTNNAKPAHDFNLISGNIETSLDDKYFKKLISIQKQPSDGNFFEVVPVPGMGVIVILKKSFGYFYNNYSDNERFAIARDIVKKLYMYEEECEVNSSDVFHWYLSKLI